MQNFPVSVSYTHLVCASDTSNPFSTKAVTIFPTDRSRLCRRRLWSSCMEKWVSWKLRSKILAACASSSDSVSKIISCCFSCFVSDFFYHQYGICRMSVSYTHLSTAAYLFALPMNRASLSCANMEQEMTINNNST